MIHIKSDGTEMLIASMEDKHLINTIKKACRMIKELSDLLDGKINYIKSEAILNGMAKQLEDFDEENIKDKLITLRNGLGDYLLECSIRNINVHETIKEAFKRDSKMTDPTAFLLAERAEEIDG